MGSGVTAQVDEPNPAGGNPATDSAEESGDRIEDRESVLPEPDRERIRVRRLRIGRDGAATDSLDSVESGSTSASDPVGVTAPPETEMSLEESAGEEADHSAGPRVTDAGDPSDLDYTGRPSEPVDLSPEVERVESAMRRCLQYYHARPENAQSRSNWGMLHSIMVYGLDTRIVAGRKSHNAIAWIAGNNVCRGKRLLTSGPDGLGAAEGVGLQGHQGQLLAVLGLVGVPADYSLYAGNEKYNVGDLVKAEAAACREGEELTFTLIGLAHYLSTEDAWTDSRGERWDFERLIREELAQPVIGAACGGTHRLMGFAHALRKRRAEGLPIDGQWARAEQYLEDFVDYTYQLQNRDGSMSTEWFEGREDNGDLDRKIQTTGHIVEWLLTVTPDSQLQDPRLVRSIRFLLSAMYNRRGHDWAIGPKGHALRSLAMYYERVFGGQPAWRVESTGRVRHTRR